MGMTKQVFLVPVEGAEFEAPQYYNTFLMMMVNYVV